MDGWDDGGWADLSVESMQAFFPLINSPKLGQSCTSLGVQPV